MARFTLPRDLYHGKGALEALKSFTGKKAMICVGGGSMKRFGFLDRAVAYLKEAGMEVELFEGIEPDPSVETVMRGAEAMLKFEPDCLLKLLVILLGLQVLDGELQASCIIALGIDGLYGGVGNEGIGIVARLDRKSVV